MSRNKGISLIVLVITIIIMIILAGTVIISLNNNGIIDRAEEAVEKTNEAQLRQIAQLGWAEAYVEYGADLDRLKEGVDEIIEKNKIDISGYGIAVTTSGVDVGWIQDGLTVKKGTTVLEVGDTIEYEAEVGGYKGGWKVLGAEDAKLLIMSTEDVASEFRFNEEYYYIRAITSLNSVCAKYGKGDGAVGARSVTVEDINRVTGYNPETAEFDKGKISEYGNKVTFWWSGNEDPYYTSTNGAEGDMDKGNHKGTFYNFNGTSYVKLTAPQVFDKENDEPIKITTLTSNYYMYHGTTLTSNSTGEIKGLAANSKAYKMIFRNSANNQYSQYWLASPYVAAYSNYVQLGFRRVYSGSVRGASFVFSYKSWGSSAQGVRAVVSLASDIQLVGSSAQGWKF